MVKGHFFRISIYFILISVLLISLTSCSNKKPDDDSDVQDALWEATIPFPEPYQMTAEAYAREFKPYSSVSPGFISTYLMMEWLTNTRQVEYDVNGRWDDQLSDEENLDIGIDCARAIWFVFTRNNLPYSRGDRYVNTKNMAVDDSPMNEGFNACPLDRPFQPGDVLVYRDEILKKGHVVMVIDYYEQIAWGSHYWEQHLKKLDTPGHSPVGTEFQKLIGKDRDWSWWDRPIYKLSNCWRHKSFEENAIFPFNGTQVELHVFKTIFKFLGLAHPSI